MEHSTRLLGLYVFSTNLTFLSEPLPLLCCLKYPYEGDSNYYGVARNLLG